eukprot:m.125608 g.125608  ORF g.125608 m.125608 type:complete len:434 (-) comp52217_c0_seq1:779-2080(-)
MAFLRKLTARDHSKLSGAETVLPTYTRAHFMSEEGVTFKEAKLVGIHPVTAKATKADILEATQKAKAYSKARGVHKKRLTVSLSIQEGFITRDERGLYTRTRTHKIYSWYQDEIEPDIFVIMAKVECDSVAVKDEYSCMVLKSPEAVGILHALTSMIQIVYNKDHPMIRAMEPLSPSTQGKPSPSVQRRPTAGADTFPQPQQSVSASALSSPASAKPFAPLSPSMSAPSISQSSATAQPPGFIAPSLTGKSNDHWSFQEENFDAKWQCSACTFLNQGLLIQCEACGQFKPSVVQQQHQQVQTPVKQTGYMNASAVRSPPGRFAMSLRLPFPCLPRSCSAVDFSFRCIMILAAPSPRLLTTRLLIHENGHQTRAKLMSSRTWPAGVTSPILCIRMLLESTLNNDNGSNSNSSRLGHRGPLKPVLARIQSLNRTM